MDDSLLHVEKSLEYNFLYKNDADSIHLLLSLLDNKHRYANLRPKYSLMKYLSTALKRTLTERKDREFILLAMKRLLNDDVNRFELSVVIDAYSQGYYNEKWVDLVERCALEVHTAEELSRMNVLFQNTKHGKAMGVKSHLFHVLKEETETYPSLRRLSSAYCKRVLRQKIYQLNHYLDKQIVIDYDDLSRLKVEENNLNIRELNHIYNKFNQYLYHNVTKVYKDAFWNGINDAVLERYAG